MILETIGKMPPALLELMKDPDFNFKLAEAPEMYRELLEEAFWSVYGREQGERYIAEIEARAQEPQEPFAVIGKPTPRREDYARVTGQARYATDVYLPGMLYVGVLRSPHPHARITKIDVSKALALPGVHAALTYKDVPRFAVDRPPDRLILDEVVRYPGEEVAVVAAEDRHIAQEAVKLIEVEYEKLPYVWDVAEAIKPNAPKIWPEGNEVHPPITRTRGNVEQGFREADVVLEDTYETQVTQHATLEPRACVARWDGDKLIVWASSQYLHGWRGLLSAALKIPRSRIKVIGEHMGGGFGDKGGADRYVILAALLAKKTGRPVRSELTRSENFDLATHRFPVRQRLRIGAKRDGTLAAMEAEVLVDAGGHFYQNAEDAAVPVKDSYTVPNARFVYRDVVTNKWKSGFQRCVGHPQSVFQLEVHMDRLAEMVGMDPLEFRLKNINTIGDQDTGYPYASCGLEECIRKGAEAIGWRAKWHRPGVGPTNGTRKHGIGMAVDGSDTHGRMVQPMAAIVKVLEDGSVDLHCGTTDIGAGQTTVMAMFAAEELGVPVEVGFAGVGDSDLVPDTGVSAGSRQTMGAGMAVKMAAADAKAKLFRLARPRLEAEPEEMAARDGYIFVKADPTRRVSVADVVKSSPAAPAAVVGEAVYVVPPRWTMRTFGAGFCELEVDTQTGEVYLLKYVGSNDVGRAINPLGVQQQMEGAFHMQWGMALMEEQLADPNERFCLNPNLWEYKLLTTMEIPTKVETIIVEPGDKVGPFGAKGVGEPPTSPPGPAIANAIYNAIGVRIKDLPITRRKILEALRAKGGRS